MRNGLDSSPLPSTTTSCFAFLIIPRSCRSSGCHFLIGLEASIERRQTHFQPALFEDIGEAALGQASMKRHLAAFKTNLGGVA